MLEQAARAVASLGMGVCKDACMATGVVVRGVVLVDVCRDMRMRIGTWRDSVGRWA